MSVRKTTFVKIYRRMEDFPLCNAISGAVEDRYGYEYLMTWPQSLPIAHRLVHFVWSTTGFLMCEGMARFFNLHCRHSAYPECFDLLGLTSLASTVRHALALFPSPALGDTDALISHFGSWDRVDQLVKPAESILFAHSERIETALARYVREHETEFESLREHICNQREFRRQLHSASRRR